MVDRKGDGTPVTEADRAAERLLRTTILAAYPDDTIVGEEEADHEGTSGRRWIIDPIDGTKAFTHGVPLYSTLLAVEDEHGPAIGVIELPALGETVYAGRGLGCFRNGTAGAHVSERGSRGGQLSDDLGIRLLARVRAAALRSVRHVHAHLGRWLWLRARRHGRVEAMVDPSAARWDLAAMPVIIGEAGGRFTDYTGTTTRRRRQRCRHQRPDPRRRCCDC